MRSHETTPQEGMTTKAFESVVICLLLIGIVITAGCTGKDYVPNGDIIVFKLDADGGEEWNTTIDRGNDERGDLIIQTSDRGYAIAGEDNRVQSGERIPAIIKLDENGTLVWQRTLREEPRLLITAILQTPDGGYRVAREGGVILALDGDGEITGEVHIEDQLSRNITGREVGITAMIPHPEGGYVLLGNVRGSPSEILVARFDAGGEVREEHTYEKRNGESALSIITTSDGGYAIAGKETDEAGVWVKRIERNGSELWHRTGEQDTNATSVRVHRIASMREGQNGTIKVLYTATYIGEGDEGSSTGAVERVFDPQGSLVQEKSLNANGPIVPTPDGGYVFAAFPMDTRPEEYADWRYGDADLHVRKIDTNGHKIWDKNVGTIKGGADAVVGTSDGGYAVLITHDRKYP